MAAIILAIKNGNKMGSLVIAFPASLVSFFPSVKNKTQSKLEQNAISSPEWSRFRYIFCISSLPLSTLASSNHDGSYWLP